ncbi:IS5/IS1182 family transposase, partial [Saccharopolyspora hirsuta]
HQFKRLRIRWERRADIHLGLMHLACVLVCYRKLPTSL